MNIYYLEKSVQENHDNLTMMRKFYVEFIACRGHYARKKWIFITVAYHVSSFLRFRPIMTHAVVAHKVLIFVPTSVRNRICLGLKNTHCIFR